MFLMMMSLGLIGDGVLVLTHLTPFSAVAKAGFCCFSKNDFVGSGKENEKNKTPPGGGRRIVFCRREPAGGVEIFDACLAGSAVGAGSC